MINSVLSRRGASQQEIQLEIAMCDFNRLAGFLIAAQVIFLAMMITLGIVIVNSGSFFLATLNIPFLIGLIVANAAATALAAAALNEANNCKNSACGTAATALASWLTAFVASLATLTGLLIVLAVVGAVPFAGAVAAAGVLGYLIALNLGLAPMIGGGVAVAAASFNTCQTQNNGSSNNAAAVVIAVLAVAIILASAFTLAGAGPTGGWEAWPFSHP
jgi:hypothetical protein